MVTLYPEYLEDYTDLGLLVQINALISDTGMQFELYKPFDQTGFVLALTADEKKDCKRSAAGISPKGYPIHDGGAG